MKKYSVFFFLLCIQYHGHTITAISLSKAKKSYKVQSALYDLNTTINRLKKFDEILFHKPWQNKSIKNKFSIEYLANISNQITELISTFFFHKAMEKIKIFCDDKTHEWTSQDVTQDLQDTLRKIKNSILDESELYNFQYRNNPSKKENKNMYKIRIKLLEECYIISLQIFFLHQQQYEVAKNAKKIIKTPGVVVR